MAYVFPDNKLPASRLKYRTIRFYEAGEKWYDRCPIGKVPGYRSDGASHWDMNSPHCESWHTWAEAPGRRRTKEDYFDWHYGKQSRLAIESFSEGLFPKKRKDGMSQFDEKEYQEGIKIHKARLSNLKERLHQLKLMNQHPDLGNDEKVYRKFLPPGFAIIGDQVSDNKYFLIHNEKTVIKSKP